MEIKVCENSVCTLVVHGVLLKIKEESVVQQLGAKNKRCVDNLTLSVMISTKVI